MDYPFLEAAILQFNPFMTNVMFQSSLTGAVGEGFPAAVRALHALLRIAAANCRLFFIHTHLVLFHCYESSVDMC